MEEKLMEERKNMLLDLMKDPTYVPMKLKELALLLGVTKEQRGELEEVLNELVASGKVGISKKGKYARSEVFAQTGVFAAHHRGFGFVTIEGESLKGIEACQRDPDRNLREKQEFRFRDPGQPADHHGYLYPPGKGKWRGIRAQSCGKAGYLRGEK